MRRYTPDSHKCANYITTYRIIETNKNTGKTWFYAKQKFLCFWINPQKLELWDEFTGENKGFSTKEELISTIKDAHKKPINTSFYHKVVDELEIAD